MMHLLETNRTGRVYQSKSFDELYAFIMLFGGEFSTMHYEDFLKGIYTVILTD